MGIKKFTAITDTTITNAYKSSLSDAQRATGSNMGASDVLEVFSIYSQASASSGELSRALLKFPVNDISEARSAKKITSSGSVNFYLRMFNAEHAFTTPSSYDIQVVPVSQSWEEGYGLDMDEYKDDTEDGVGANWLNATSTTKWIRGSATATVTVLNEGFIETGDTITLVSTDGTSVVATATATTNTSTAQTTAVQFSHNGANTTAQATLIATAINYSSYFAATSDGAVVTITQDVPGSSGNTTVTCLDVGGAGPWFSNTNFTGGTDRVGGTFDYEPAYSVSFDKGHEDLEVEITELVEEWMSEYDSTAGDQRANYGVGVFLGSTYEVYHSSSALVSTGETITGVPDDGVLLHNVTGSKKSYYTKKFFSRTSEYFFKRPIIEARWNSAIKDDRGNFYASSSLATAAENLNTVYLYNVVRGQLRNLPDVGSGPVFVQIYDEYDSGSAQTVQNSGSETLEGYSTWQITNNFITGGIVPDRTGIYSASFSIDTTSSVIYDRWFAEGTPHQSPTLGYGYSAICYHTGTINVQKLESQEYNPNKKYVSRVTNMKSQYSQDETARFRIFVRQRDWNPNIYTKATTDISSEIVNDAYYKIVRIQDNETVVDYGTGSAQHTLLSYDVKGNYFDFDMSSLEKGYSYGIKLTYRRDNVYHEQPETFKFRVE